MRTTCLSLFISVAGASLAHGEGTGWHVEGYTQSVDQKVSATGDFEYSGVILNTADPNKPELKFSCSERYGLTATIAFIPIAEANYTNQFKNVRFRWRSSVLAIEGRESAVHPWYHVRQTHIVQSRSAKTAAMLFNAAIQGKAITVKEPLGDTITIQPPPIDDNFRQFVADCHVTNGSEY